MRHPKSLIWLVEPCRADAAIRSSMVQAVISICRRGMRIATPVCALVRNDIPVVRRMKIQCCFLAKAFLFTPVSTKGLIKLKTPKRVQILRSAQDDMLRCGARMRAVGDASPYK